MEMNYASRGVAGTALGTGIAGLALGVLNGGQGGGILNGLTGGGYSRTEAEKDARIAQLETQVQLRDANVYTDSKLNDLRNYVDNKFSAVNDKLCAQAVHNATNDAIVGCIQNQVNQLMGLTKLVVPNASICPGWGNVNVTPATTTTAGA